METLQRLSARSKEEIVSHLSETALRWQLPYRRQAAAPTTSIDTGLVTCLSTLASSGALSLPEAVRLVRGQTVADPRPNKHLYEVELPQDPGLRQTCRRWNRVVREGVRPDWHSSKPLRQATQPTNHSSIWCHMSAVRAHVAAGQHQGRYLVVDVALLSVWPEVFISPLGVVAKGDADSGEVRVINDYSFPELASVNDFTDRTHFPVITYNPPSDIAQRMASLRRAHPDERILMSLGDVAGAFRHVPVHEEHVHMFVFILDDYLVIDLALGFGWCGSPAWYYLPGTLINAQYEAAVPPPPHLSDPYRGNFWCDDHTCVEVDGPGRCFRAQLALRRAMATVLGPDAINERKFTGWFTRGKALGLLWDTTAGTVSIPADKIVKAQLRLDTILTTGRSSRTGLLQLLGSLRHVASCCPPARAFFQRIQAVTASLPRLGQRRLPTSAADDIRWFRAILCHADRLNKIPVTLFGTLPEVSVHVHMDASDDGVCVLEPKLRQFIRYQFSPAVKAAITTDGSSNSINVRELLSGVLAVLQWGPTWALAATRRPTHVRFHIDNASAVSWTTRRSSRQHLAQLYNRLISLAEFQYDIVCTAEHIPGILNTMADAGSRAWTAHHPLWSTWTNLCSGWTQVPVRPPFDDLSALWEHCSDATPSQALPIPSTVPIGANGANSRR